MGNAGFYKQAAERYRKSLGDYDNPDMFSLGYQWADKPHRHVNDLCKLLEDASSELAAGNEWLNARAAVLQELAETKAELAAKRERVDKLREALEIILDVAKEWCKAVDKDSSWDGWDQHFKAMLEVIPVTDAALAETAPLGNQSD